jgi:hypothetical protein
MKKPQYMILKTVKARGVAPLESIAKVDDHEDLAFGVSRAKGWTPNATFRMDKDFPKDVGTADAFVNTSLLLVVSERAKNALEAVPGALFENEVLPVSIVNHKKRVEKGPYFIIHQVNQPPCLDEKASQGVRMPINPTKFQFMMAMVLDEKKVGEKKMLFRVEQFPDVPLVRRDLAEALQAEKLSGLELHEIAGFNFLTLI